MNNGGQNLTGSSAWAARMANLLKTLALFKISHVWVLFRWAGSLYTWGSLKACLFDVIFLMKSDLFFKIFFGRKHGKK